MPMFIPYGCESGVWIEVETRIIAAHYGVRSPDHLLGESPASDLVLQARDALAWRLVRQLGLSIERASTLTQCDVDTVRAGVASHEARLKRFRERNAA